MSFYDASSRAGSAGPSSRGFLSRLESLGPTESGVGDSVDMRSTTAGMDIDDDDGTERGDDDGADGVFHPALLAPSSEEGELDDLRRLGRVWVRERGTPAILAWEGELLDSLLDKVEQQVRLSGCGGDLSGRGKAGRRGGVTRSSGAI